MLRIALAFGLLASTEQVNKVVVDAFQTARRLPNPTCSISTTAIRQAEGESILDRLPQLPQIPNPFGGLEIPEAVAAPGSIDYLTGAEYEPTTEGLILQAKRVLSTDLGLRDASLLDDERFKWIGPVLDQPLGKTDYLAAGRFFDLRSAFPDFDYRAHDFRTDENDGSTVRLTCRVTGTMRGELRLRDEVLKPNGVRMVCPPETISMTFDISTGKVIKLCTGFAMDRLVGNTAGTTGVMAAATVAGMPPSEWEIYPVTAVVQRFVGRPVKQLPESQSFLAPFPETVMIQLAKGILAANMASKDPSLLSSDFTYCTPFTGPIRKSDYLEKNAAAEFDGIDPIFSHFRVDPYDPLRVWVDLRPTAPGYEGSPQAMSFTFDDDGFCTRITSCAVLDQTLGNGGGLGGVEGYKYAMGKSSPGVATRPLPRVLGRLRKRALQPFTGIGVDDYSLPLETKSKKEVKPPASPPPIPSIPRTLSPLDKLPSIRSVSPSATLEESRKRENAERERAAQAEARREQQEAERRRKETEESRKREMAAKAAAAEAQREVKAFQQRQASETAIAAAAAAAAKAQKAAAAAEAQRREKALKQQQAAEAEAQRREKALERQQAAENAAEALWQERAAKAEARREQQEARKEEAERRRRETAEAREQEMAARAAAAEAQREEMAFQRQQAAEAAAAAKAQKEAERAAAQQERLLAEQQKKELLEARKQELAAEAAAAAEAQRQEKALKQQQAARAAAAAEAQRQEKALRQQRAAEATAFAEAQRQERALKQQRAAEAAAAAAERRRKEKAALDTVTTAKPGASISLFGPPKGVPTLTRWRKNKDGSITGNISGSKNFSNGDLVTTSPIASGQVKNGGVVKTGSGSSYILGQQAGEDKKAALDKVTAAKPGASISLFGLGQKADEDADKRKKAALDKVTAAKPGASISLFGFGQKADEDADKRKKAALDKVTAAKPGGTISLFGRGQRAGKDGDKTKKEKAVPAKKLQTGVKTAPKGVPTLTRWRKNADGSVTGRISGSKNFSDGELITTSPLASGQVKNGEVVKTGSGSRYFLK